MNGSGEEAAPRPRTTSSSRSQIAFELSCQNTALLVYYTLSSYSSKLKRLAQGHRLRQTQEDEKSIDEGTSRSLLKREKCGLWRWEAKARWSL